MMRAVFIVTILLSVAVGSTAIRLQMNLDDADATPTEKHYVVPKVMSLAGCKRLYLDVGSNVGLNLRSVFEPEKYPLSNLRANMSKYLGDENIRSKPFAESGICAIGFEANPKFIARHDAITSAYRAKGWNVQYLTPAIVLDHDGEVTFHVDVKPAGTGSSIADRLKVPNGNTVHKKFTEQTLPSINFTQFMEEHVMPLRPQLEFVMMKMDIESSEYIVLPALAKSSALCAGEGIDLALVEYHKWAPETALFKEAGPLQAHLAKELQKCKNPTVFDEIGGETYGKSDPAPLPTF